MTGSEIRFLLLMSKSLGFNIYKKHWEVWSLQTAVDKSRVAALIILLSSNNLNLAQHTLSHQLKCIKIIWNIYRHLKKILSPGNLTGLQKF